MCTNARIMSRCCVVRRHTFNDDSLLSNSTYVRPHPAQQLPLAAYVDCVLCLSTALVECWCICRA